MLTNTASTRATSAGITAMDLNGTTNTIDVHSVERIQNFEEAYNKIKSATGITDIEELVRTFIKNEDHNFSLFNYVNEQVCIILMYCENVCAYVLLFCV